MKTKNILVIALLLVTASCARNLSSNSYVDSSTSGMVLEGVIVSARPVTVNSSDKLGGNGTGILAGGLVGGVAGNQIGGGSGNVAATIGGVLLGAAAGAAAEGALSESEGMEYIVKLNNDNVGTTGHKDELSINTGSKKPSTKTIDSNLKSNNLISVVQGADVKFAVGTPVYIIYSDDRPRLTAK